MMKFLTVQIILIALSIQHILAFGESPIPSEAGTGFRKVSQGSIAHCETDPGQQCFRISPSLDNISITNPSKLDIACEPDNLCVFAFPKDQKQFSQTNFTINCLNFLGTPDGSNITVSYGTWGSYAGDYSLYGQFTVQGDYAAAKWDSDPDYHGAKAGSVQTAKHAETLDSICYPFPNHIKSTN